jgi:predicted deacetylase
MSARTLVVSVHDVSPHTRERVAAILGDLLRAGVRRASLLVVPDHHHRGNINSDPAFTAWLREAVGAGHEAVLHGYFHQRERRGEESARTRLFTRFYTADEGEFFDIEFAEARALLERGRDDLTQCAGVAPVGFIAPAWLLSAEGEAAAREAGFAYTTRLRSVSALASGRAHRTQSLCWSVRRNWRRWASLGWNPALFRSLGGNAVMRISIHPPDFEHPDTRGQILRLTRRAIESREATTYAELMRRWDP